MKKIILAIALLTFASNSAFCADKTKAGAKPSAWEMTTKQREEMAVAHEKMAVCLRSDKSLEDCQRDMMQSCKGMTGKEDCPMMMMGRMHGMRGYGMMHDHGKMQEEKSEKNEAR